MRGQGWSGHYGFLLFHNNYLFLQGWMVENGTSLIDIYLLSIMQHNTEVQVTGFYLFGLIMQDPIGLLSHSVVIVFLPICWSENVH